VREGAQVRIEVRRNRGGETRMKDGRDRRVGAVVYRGEDWW